VHRTRDPDYCSEHQVDMAAWNHTPGCGFATRQLKIDSGHDKTLESDSTSAHPASCLLVCNKVRKAERRRTHGDAEDSPAYIEHHTEGQDDVHDLLRCCVDEHDSNPET
jgi:hypothetical protein